MPRVRTKWAAKRAEWEGMDFLRYDTQDFDINTSSGLGTGNISGLPYFLPV